jgi:hypothetical protein
MCALINLGRQGVGVEGAAPIDKGAVPAFPLAANSAGHRSGHFASLPENVMMMVQEFV